MTEITVTRDLSSYTRKANIVEDIHKIITAMEDQTISKEFVEMYLYLAETSHSTAFEVMLVLWKKYNEIFGESNFIEDRRVRYLTSIN